MSLSIVRSSACVGTDAPAVSVEVHLSRGLPSCSIVGLPETAVKESRDRVRGAILSSGFEMPRKRIIVNLAPADLRKEGGRFDLAIALGILAASKQIKTESLSRYLFLGELALSGEVRPVRGALIAAMSIRRLNLELVLPLSSGREAALVDNIRAVNATSLSQVCAVLNGIEEFETITPEAAEQTRVQEDFSDVIGQPFARRAMEIAAAGHHSVLMTGPPGAGKTMLASRLGSIMPLMTEAEALESAAIHSLCSAGFNPKGWRQRPFRAPHHSASGAALIGGGSVPAPGEISLAHHGVLFLDELPEFSRHVLELLREPMEAGVVHISRARHQSSFMTRFLFVAAANPCPCGYHGDPDRCRCRPEQIDRYNARLSGPLLDRIDMHLPVSVVPRREMRAARGMAESSREIRARVCAARQIQLDRQGKANALLRNSELAQFCKLSDQLHDLLDNIADRFQLSTRAVHRIIKLARTIADLQGSAAIDDKSLLLASRFRCRQGAE